MQPHDKRAKLQKATLPRCRMVIKTYLPFLPGFPVPEEFLEHHSSNGTPWCSSSETSEILLTPESIRLANYGWNELYKFPAVFPKAVEDYEAWRAAVPWMLEQLGKAVYGKTSLPKSLWSQNLGFSASDSRRAESLSQTHPRLKLFLDAMSWLTVLQPDQLVPMLDWIETEHERLVNIFDSWPGIEGFQLALLLFRLVQLDGPTRVAPILETLGTADARNISTNCWDYRKKWDDLLKNIAKQTRIPKSIKTVQKPFKGESPSRPTGEWASAVYGFTKRIADFPPKQRRVALELFAENIPANLLKRWRSWWHEMEPTIASAEKLVLRAREGVYEDFEKRSQQAREISTQLKKFKHIMPPVLDAKRMSYKGLIEMLCHWDDPVCQPYRKICRSLTQDIPIEQEQRVPRIASLFSLYKYITTCRKEDEPRLGYPLFFKELSRWDIPVEFVPNLVMRMLLLEDFNREEMTRAGRAIRNWYINLGQKQLSGKLIELVKAISDEAKIIMFSPVLTRAEFKEEWRVEASIPLAAKLANNETEFAHLLILLSKIYCQDEAELPYGSFDSLVALTQFLFDTPWRNALVTLFSKKELSPVLEVSEPFEVLEKNGITVPLPGLNESAACEWISEYPDVFSETLHQLALLTPRAEQIASRKLGDCVFSPEKTAEEIETLQQRLSATTEPQSICRIQKRIENLQKRLLDGDAAKPSESRLRKLQTKLEERTHRIFFEQLRETCNRLFEQMICKEFDFTTFPSSWREPLHRRIISGIHGMDDNKPVKRIGIKLVRSIVGVEPWDYRNDPANTNFIQRMRDLGIEPTPWLEPNPPEKHVFPSGQVLMLGFETEPWEVLKMGAPFKTCLSPWDFNYFSTIANAVDINKHVLYGRNTKGMIVARCLITLSDGGELLAFHPYAHEKDIGFKNVVAEYLERLARRMNTVVVEEGAVSNLISPDWYDDGSITINDLFSFLKDGTKFRKKLLKMEPDQLLTELEKELTPHPLRPYVLTPLLKLPEFEKRPELVTPLIPFVSPALGAYELVKMISFVNQTGRKQDAVRLVMKYLIPKMERMIARHAFWRWEQVAAEMVKIAPEVILPYVRRLESDKPKILTTYQANACRELLASIYEALGRKRKAKAVRESIIKE